MNIENLTETDKQELQRILNLMNTPSFEYPIYKKIKGSDQVVKFTDLKMGEVIVAGTGRRIGQTCNDFFRHTDTDIWEDFDPAETETEKSLRDEFAMEALNAIISAIISKIPLIDREGELGELETQDFINRLYVDVSDSAYYYADAMMERRKIK